MKTEFNQVICVTSGCGFIKDHIYAQIGDNNGMHILRDDGGGECFVFLACTGGIGKGFFNNFDNSGYPSFIPIEWEDGYRAIEETKNELNKLNCELTDCKNELCLKCGAYKERHLGACDNCRWR